MVAEPWSELMVTVPLREAIERGEKMTLIVQDVEGARVAGQVLVCE